MFLFLKQWLYAAGLAYSALKQRGLAVQPTVPAPIDITLTGHLSTADAKSYVYENFDVPDGVTGIYVAQTYSRSDSGNRLDMGIWDQTGHELALDGDFTTGFRGWSGHSRSEFTVSPESATPGYIPGPIEPGSWSIGMEAHSIVDEGLDYELHIRLTFDPVTSDFEPAYAPSRVGEAAPTEDDGQTPIIEPPIHWYRGDLHTHSIYSDAIQTPQDIVAAARAANLSFFFSTEHNTQSLNLVWGTMAPDDMLVGRGIEVTTMSGHWNALGLTPDQWVEFRYTESKDLLPAVDHLQRSGGFAGMNHPYITGCYLCNWVFSDESFAHMDSVEVWNGPWADLNENALTLWQNLLVNGSTITAVGGSDSHDAVRRVGEPTTVVGAPELSTAAILDGMRASRVYLLRYADVDLEFTVQDGGDLLAHVGDTVDRQSTTDTLSAVVRTSGVPDDARAILISDTGAFHEQNETATAGDMKVDIDTAAKFVRLEVRDGNNAMLGMTNPIWFE